MNSHVGRMFDEKRYDDNVLRILVSKVGEHCIV